MKNELIFRPLNTDSETISPLDISVKKIVNNKKVHIVCPYINLDYLIEILNLSNGEWELITNIEAWLMSSENNKRIEIRNFINKNFDKIKHQNNIHAKLIITDKEALLGSANLTTSGIFINTEMSVLFHKSGNELNEVDELNKWFKNLWNSIKSNYIISEIDKFCSEINKIKSIKPNHILNSDKNIKTKKSLIIENKIIFLNSFIKQFLEKKDFIIDDCTPTIIRFINKDIDQKIKKTSRNWTTSGREFLFEIWLQDNKIRFNPCIAKVTQLTNGITDETLIYESFSSQIYPGETNDNKKFYSKTLVKKEFFITQRIFEIKKEFLDNYIKMDIDGIIDKIYQNILTAKY